MKLLFLSLSFCVSFSFSHAQLSLSSTTGDEQPIDSGELRDGIPNGAWTVRYKDGNTQFLRTYSFDKWKQFQNEKIRYHPKRHSLAITRLFHENKKQAEKYITAVNTFCDIYYCSAPDKDVEGSHYHPPFKNGLLHGPFANYFPDGSMKDTGNYKNGLPEGEWIKWTGDKQFYWKGFYKHGVKTNEWKLYAASNRLVSIVSFRNGKYLWRKDMKDGVEIEQEELSGF